MASGMFDRAPHLEGEPGAALIAAAIEAEASAAARRAVADAEIGRPLARRLDEEARARAALIADGVVGEVSAMLRAAEPSLDGPHADDIPRRFARAGLIARSGLGAAALARADEHRLAAALAGAADAAFDDAEDSPDVPDPAFGEERAGVARADAARLDRAGDPLLPLHDIAAEDRHALFWHVAACLAAATLAPLGAARSGGEDAVHRAAAAAVGRTLATIDDGAGIAPAALRLAHRMEADGALDDDAIAGALAHGRVMLLAASLAVRAGIGIDPARAMLGDPARLAVMLRACAIERDVAAAMILTLALARGGEGDPAHAAAALIESFDALPVDRARAIVRRARLEPHYRDALDSLEAGR